MWWYNLSTLQQLCFIVGCTSGILTLIALALAVSDTMRCKNAERLDGAENVGADKANALSATITANAADTYSDGFVSGLKMLSVRISLVFLCVCGWLIFATGFCLDLWAAFLVGIAGGAIAAVVLAVVMRKFKKLQNAENPIAENIIGKTVQVCLAVPAKRSGRGKASLNVNEKSAEFEAVTDGGSIPAGMEVRVAAIAPQNVLVVETFKSASVKASVKPYAK